MELYHLCILLTNGIIAFMYPTHQWNYNIICILLTNGIMTFMYPTHQWNYTIYVSYSPLEL